VKLVGKRLTPKTKKKLLPVLDAALGDGDPGVRSEAVAGYASCGCDEAPAVLRKGLKDSAPMVRLAAAEGFARVRFTAIVAELVELLNPRDIVLNRAIASALQFQTGQSFGDNPQQWQRWLADNRN
jgi:HEAT repeat protein